MQLMFAFKTKKQHFSFNKMTNKYMKIENILLKCCLCPWVCGMGMIVIGFVMCLLFRTARWRALLAGAVAGQSMLLTGLEAQHTSLAIYILMRAAVLASRCGIKSERFGRICKPLTWKHGDIFLMCLSSSQILYVTILCSLSLFI